MKKQLLLIIVLAGVGLSLSLDARRGYRGYRGGYRKGYRYRGYPYRRYRYRGYPYRRYGGYYGYPYGGFGISVGSGPRYSCYRPGGPYNRYPGNPRKNPYGYRRWLQARYNNWQQYWNVFQDYLSCRESNKPQVGFSFGVGAGYPGYYGYRGRRYRW